MIEGLVVQIPAPSVHMAEESLGKTLNPISPGISLQGSSHLLVYGCVYESGLIRGHCKTTGVP